MSCGCGNEKEKNQGKSFPKAVVEINNPESIVMFRRVVIPASLGDETAVPAAIGKYFNVILEYEASGSVYLYSSDGIPTKLTLNIAQLEERLDTRIDQEIAEGLETGLATKQDILTAGENITIEDNVISAEGETYSAFVGATGSEAGEAGLVPAPAAADNTKFLKGDGTWATVSGGSTYSAGEGINIANDEISVDTTVIATAESVEEAAPLSGDSTPTTSTAGALGQTYVNETTGEIYYLSQIIEIQGADDQYVWTKFATGADVNDATITITNNGESVDSFTVNAAANKTIALSAPEITMTTTDPGEGSTLSNNQFVAVYGGDPIILDYDTTEVSTGTTWIDGRTIYKKTVQLTNIGSSTSISKAHGVSNLAAVINFEGFYSPSSGNWMSLLAGSTNTEMALWADTTNIHLDFSTSWGTNYSGYVTIYYTKSS